MNMNKFSNPYNEKSTRAPIASIEVMEDFDILSGNTKGVSEHEIPANDDKSNSGVDVKIRYLGKSGFRIPNLGLGTLKVFNQESCLMSENIIKEAFENGINFFEISDPIHFHRHERELGRIIKKQGWLRRQFIICAKIFWSKSEVKALNRREIIESAKQTLKNLQLEYVDILIIYKNDLNCPIDETIRAMNYLLDHGMIMYWGTARWSPVEIFETYSQCRQLNMIAPICELGEYHWFHREKVELYMAELYNKVGIGLLTWSPISLGLCLSESENPAELFLKLASKGQKVTHSSKALDCSYNENQSKILRLKTLSDSFNCSLTQLCVAWMLRNLTAQCVIISGGNVEELRHLIQCLAIAPKLNATCIEEMDKILNNKPSRPPMISSLQQLWATTGGIPPC